MGGKWKEKECHSHQTWKEEGDFILGTKTFCLSITANKVLEMIVIGWNYGDIPLGTVTYFPSETEDNIFCQIPEISEICFTG